jgi:hypothetical protein
LDPIHRNANTKILKRNIAKLKGIRTQQGGVYFKKDLNVIKRGRIRTLIMKRRRIMAEKRKIVSTLVTSLLPPSAIAKCAIVQNG